MNIPPTKDELHDLLKAVIAFDVTMAPELIVEEERYSYSSINYKIVAPPSSSRAKRSERCSYSIPLNLSPIVKQTKKEAPSVDFKKISQDRLLEALYDLLCTLPPRELDILKRRYCRLPYEEAHTFETLGAEYGISRQRVQQIERNALKKLRQALNDKFSEK